MILSSMLQKTVCSATSKPGQLICLKKTWFSLYLWREMQRYFSDSKYPNCVLSSWKLYKPGEPASPLHPSAPHIKIRVSFFPSAFFQDRIPPAYLLSLTELVIPASDIPEPWHVWAMPSKSADFKASCLQVNIAPVGSDTEPQDNSGWRELWGSPVQPPAWSGVNDGGLRARIKGKKRLQSPCHRGCVTPGWKRARQAMGWPWCLQVWKLLTGFGRTGNY